MRLREVYDCLISASKAAASGAVRDCRKILREASWRLSHFEIEPPPDSVEPEEIAAHFAEVAGKASSGLLVARNGAAEDCLRRMNLAAAEAVSTAKANPSPELWRLAAEANRCRLLALQAYHAGVEAEAAQALADCERGSGEAEPEAESAAQSDSDSLPLSSHLRESERLTERELTLRYENGSAIMGIPIIPSRIPKEAGQ